MKNILLTLVLALSVALSTPAFGNNTKKADTATTAENITNTTKNTTNTADTAVITAENITNTTKNTTNTADTAVITAENNTGTTTLPKNTEDPVKEEENIDTSPYDNMSNEEKSAALVSALYDGDLEKTKILIKNGAKAENEEEFNLIAGAVQDTMDSTIMKFFVQSKVDIYPTINEPQLNIAVRTRDINQVRDLIKNGADVNVKGNGEITPLMWASIEGGDIEIARLLIDAGANANAASTKSYTPLTPLIWASTDGGNIEIVKLLLDKGADIEGGKVGEGDNGKSPLIWSLENKNFEITKLLVDRGAEINTMEAWGHTPLMISVSDKNIERVQFFIDAGADINTQYKEHDGTINASALIWASDNGNIEIVKLLIKNGANVNAAYFDGTPLRIAAYRGHTEIVKLLKNAGATE